jgi:hypothetical protein
MTLTRPDQAGGGISNRRRFEIRSPSQCAPRLGLFDERAARLDDPADPKDWPRDSASPPHSAKPHHRSLPGQRVGRPHLAVKAAATMCRHRLPPRQAIRQVTTRSDLKTCPLVSGCIAVRQSRLISPLWHDQHRDGETELIVLGEVGQDGCHRPAKDQCLMKAKPIAVARTSVGKRSVR